MSEEKKVCIVCGKPSKQTICERCEANIQAEAVDKKSKIEKKVQVGGEVIADKKIGHKN